MAQTSFGQIPGIKKVVVTWTYVEGIVVSAEVESRSRPGLVHYSRILLDPSTLKVKKETCSCEAFVFNRKCWHLKELEKMITSDPKIREETENARKEIERAEDTAFWG